MIAEVVTFFYLILGISKSNSEQDNIAVSDAINSLDKKLDKLIEIVSENK